MLSAATDTTQGACENGFSVPSPLPSPELPAANTTTAPASAAALVAVATGLRGSNWA